MTLREDDSSWSAPSSVRKVRPTPCQFAPRTVGATWLPHHAAASWTAVACCRFGRGQPAAQRMGMEPRHLSRSRLLSRCLTASRLAFSRAAAGCRSPGARRPSAGKVEVRNAAGARAAEPAATSVGSWRPMCQERRLLQSTLPAFCQSPLSASRTTLLRIRRSALRPLFGLCMLPPHHPTASSLVRAMGLARLRLVISCSSILS